VFFYGKQEFQPIPLLRFNERTVEKKGFLNGFTAKVYSLPDSLDLKYLDSVQGSVLNLVIYSDKNMKLVEAPGGMVTIQ
jgi:hypothetical protein